MSQPQLNSSPSVENYSSLNSSSVSKRNLIVLIVSTFIFLSGALVGYYIGVKNNPDIRKNTISEIDPSISPPPIHRPIPVIHPVTRSTSVPASTPSITPLPVADLQSLSGKLVFWNNDSITVSDINGANQMRLVDNKNKQGFAGWSNGGRVFYFTELVGTTGKVYKKDLSSGITSLLFDYNSDGKNTETFATNVNISPDGNYAVYSHDYGDLSLFNLTSKTYKKLLGAGSCGDRDPIIGCYGYYLPRWSPDGKKVVAEKIFYEGSAQVLIDPFTNPVQETVTKSAGNPESWSKDGQQLVIPGSGFGEGSLYLYTHLANPDVTDLLANDINFKGSSVSSGAISGNGKIAFSYSKSVKPESGIALYIPGQNLIKPLLILDGDISVLSWLPDNKTIIYENDSSIWSLDTTTLTQNKLSIDFDLFIGIIEP